MGGRAETFKATELDPETAGRLMRDLLAPFPSSRLIRAVVHRSSAHTWRSCATSDFEPTARWTSTSRWLAASRCSSYAGHRNEKVGLADAKTN
jgi:hypothetical protein